MAVISVEDVKALVGRLLPAVVALEERLNELDKALGDGDTGTMMARLIKSLHEVDDGPETLDGLFSAYSIAASESTGSSLGTLVSGALLAASEVSRSKGAAIYPTDLADLLGGARDTMLELGRSRLGDKTIIDSIDAVFRALTALEFDADLKRLWIEAAEQSVTSFKGRPCRVGRARMFPDKSATQDDPGMVAFLWISQAAAGNYQERPRPGGSFEVSTLR